MPYLPHQLAPSTRRKYKVISVYANIILIFVFLLQASGSSDGKEQCDSYMWQIGEPGRHEGGANHLEADADNLKEAKQLDIPHQACPDSALGSTGSIKIMPVRAGRWERK